MLVDLNTLREFQLKWNIDIDGLHPHAGNGIIAFGCRGKDQVVLKVAKPDREFLTQLKFMQLLPESTGARLLDYDADAGALLMERISPGISLWDLWEPTLDDQHTELLAQCSARVALEPVSGFPTVSEWGQAFHRYRERYGKTGPLPAEHLNRARDLLDQLTGPDQPSARLLHGDLHHGNLLSSGAAWKCLDPKGVVGDPSFEIYAMIRNPVDRLLPSSDVMDRRIRITSEVTGLDAQRLRAWSFVGCILSACWSVEDEEEGWEHALACAACL